MNQELILILSSIVDESKLCTETVNAFHCTFASCDNCILITYEDREEHYVYKIIKMGERILCNNI